MPRMSRIALVTILSAFVATAIAPSAHADQPTPQPTPVSNSETETVAPQPPITLQQWCQLLAPPSSADTASAAQLMSGTINLGKYGTYAVTDTPTWDAQSTVDTAGNRDVASLSWLLPLLRIGKRTNDAAMLMRGSRLAYQWLEANPANRKSGPSDWPLIAGKRITALSCASHLLDDSNLRVAARREAARLERETANDRAPNNTHLVGNTALLMNACADGNQQQIQALTQRLNRNAARVVNTDGSDIEGSPDYARFTLNLLNSARSAMVACQQDVAFMTQEVDLLATFIAHAIRPDFRLETIGDSVAATVSAAGLPSPSPLSWAASRGRQGTPPANTYAVFHGGGYVFARSGWTPDATFYSLRATPTGPRTTHAHNDSMSMTLWSNGVNWLADPGPYRYANSSPMRKFIVKREAHSTITIGEPTKLRRGGFSFVSSTADQDQTCMTDSSWPSIHLTRCVTFLKSRNTFVIEDRVIDRRTKGKTLPVTQRWQIAPGVSAAPSGQQLTLTDAQGKKLSLISDAPSLIAGTAGNGRTAGWHTDSYGVLKRGSVAAAQWTTKPKTTRVVTTVISPNAVSVQRLNQLLVITADGQPGLTFTSVFQTD